MAEGRADEWYTVEEVASLLKVNVETVRRWIRAGDLRVLNLGSAKAGYRVRRSELDRFTEERLGYVGKSAA